MRGINSLGPITPRKTTRRNRAGEPTTAFSLPEETREATPVTSSVPVARALLDLQEAGTSDLSQMEQEITRWSDNALGSLRKLQVALLEGGEVSQQLLNELDTLCSNLPEGDAGGLSTLANSIQVRVAIETARMKKNKIHDMDQEEADSEGI